MDDQTRNKQRLEIQSVFTVGMWHDSLSGYGRVVDALTDLLAAEYTRGEAASKDKTLHDFAEFCHKRYLGTDSNWNSPTEFDYSYSSEVVTMVDEYLAQLNAADKEAP